MLKIKNNKYFSMIFLGCFLFINATAQKSPSKDEIDGTYLALFEEKGVSGYTKDKKIQLAENNGVKMLAVAACEKCFPAIYTYDLRLSEQFKKTVFKNSMGLYVLVYDMDSFIIIMPSLKINEDFSYHNFYTKSAEKIKHMSKKKIADYALPLLDFL